MGFIEKMAKAKAYDEIKNKEIMDTISAASTALQEQKVKEANMSKVFNDFINRQRPVDQNTSRIAPEGLANSFTDVNVTAPTNVIPEVRAVDNNQSGLARQQVMDMNTTR